MKEVLPRARPGYRPPLLDRAIAAVSPVWAAKRAVARFQMARAGAMTAMASGYDAAGDDRAALRGWRPQTRTTADQDSLPRLEDQRARAREMHMNAPIARGAVQTVVTNVVGTGLTLTAQANRDALAKAGITDAMVTAAERDMESEWGLFTSGFTADAKLRLTWAQMQELAMTSPLISGDAFVAVVASPAPVHFDLALQLIEADSVSNPNRMSNTDTMADGIEYSASQIWQAVHVAEMSRTGRAVIKEWRRLPVRAEDGSPRVLHLMRPDRIDQSRGVPYLAPVMAALKDLGTYSEAELRAAVLNACVAIIGKTAEGKSPLADEAAATGNAAPAPGGGLKRADIGFTPGMVIEGFADETLESFSSDRPSTGFDPFVIAILRQIGVGLELPFEVLIKHFTASYSAARAALLEAWKFYRGRRAWLAETLHQPVYGLVMENAVRRGRLALPGFLEDPLLRAAWLEAAWTGPSPGQINPEVEAKAARERIGLKVSTRTRETAELTGEHWETTARKLAKEQALMRDLGIDTPPEERPAPPGNPVPPQDQPQRQDMPEDAA